MMKKFIINAFVLSLLFSSIACGEGSTDFDTDGDGDWNEDEFNTAYNRNFGNWDTGNDDLIDQNEFYAATHRGVDTDNDGFVDEVEWREGMNNMYGNNAYARDYEAYDFDGDGLIDDEEWNRAFTDSDWFEAYDLNEDGYLDRDELNRGVFGRMDENRDRVIDPEEQERFGSYYLDAEY